MEYMLPSCTNEIHLALLSSTLLSSCQVLLGNYTVVLVHAALLYNEKKYVSLKRADTSIETFSNGSWHFALLSSALCSRYVNISWETVPSSAYYLPTCRLLYQLENHIRLKRANTSIETFSNGSWHLALLSSALCSRYVKVQLGEVWLGHVRQRCQNIFAFRGNSEIHTGKVFSGIQQS